MLTILNAIELSTDYLNQKGVESPRINAELLLAEILNCKRMDLYLKFDQPLSGKEKTDYREFIKRRGNREPLQYIIGSVEFYGINLKVNKNVLIPRQETELLVEEIISNAKDNSSLSILDIGTGSGNIAISLIKNLNKCSVHSIDVSESALALAKNNAIDHEINGKLTFENIDIEKFSQTGNIKYDLIVSNPPYISAQDYIDLEKELVDFEPKIALTDNEDGLTFYKLITENSRELLNVGGYLFFEIGFGQSKQITEFMKKNGFRNIKIKKDYQNIDRVISGELL